MALDRKSVADFFRAQDPDYYQEYSDADIFRSALVSYPEIAERFEYQLEV